MPGEGSWKDLRSSMTLHLMYDIPDELWISAARRARTLKQAVEDVGAAKYPAWFFSAGRYRPDLKTTMQAVLGTEAPSLPIVFCAARCGRPARAKRDGGRGSLCVPCAARRRKGGVVGPEGDRVRAKGSRCEAEGCESERYAKGLCHFHWQRMRSWGVIGGGRLRRNWRLAGFSSFDMRACKEFVYGRRYDRPATDEGIRLRIDYEAIIKNDPCVYCGGPAGETEHIVPVSRGGSPEWDNLAGACRSCNSSKHATPLLMYLLVKNGR